MTRKSIALPMSIGLLAVLVAAAFFVFGNPARSEAAGGPPKSRDNIVVALVGTGTLLDAADNPDDAPDGALCFTIDMFDPKTKDQVGEATDCLSGINPVGDGMSLTGTTTFNFSDENELVSQGVTSVQPLLANEGGFTHMTGSPAPNGNTSIINGEGKFEHVSGKVRLSGLVNLSLLGSGIITFDCMFVIDLNGAN